MKKFYDLFVKPSPVYTKLSGSMKKRLEFVSERMDLIREISETREAALFLSANESAVILRIVTECIDAFKEETALYEIFEEVDNVKMYEGDNPDDEDIFVLELKLLEKN